MRKKHHSVFKNHLRYVMNSIHKTFKARILHYDKHLHEMFDIYHYLYPPSKKVQEHHKSKWVTRDKPFDEKRIHKAIRLCLTKEMWYDINSKQVDYLFTEHEYWVYILNTLEVKNYCSMDFSHINNKNDTTRKKAVNEYSDRNESLQVFLKNDKAGTGKN